MTQPRLSICIATYNRAEYIGETLQSIIPQITDEVEIVVADGASTDATDIVVKALAQTCRQLHYIRLPSKGGVDLDYCKAVELAQGDYCWLFTDDDLLKPGAVKAVLNEITKEYSLIVVNAEVMNKDFTKVLENKRLQTASDEIFEKPDMEVFFNRAVSYLSFIGCVVINRDLWLEREKERYFGTEFIHVGVIFQAPLPARAMIIAEPYIIIRLGNAQWTPHAFEIWMSKWPNLIESFTHVSEKARSEYRMSRSWKSLRNIITFRAMGGYSLKEYHKWFASKDNPFGWRLVVWFAAVTPACFVNLLLLVYFKVMRILAALFTVVTPACLARPFMLSYFKMIKKESLKTIYYLENNENNIMNIMRSKVVRPAHK